MAEVTLEKVWEEVQVLPLDEQQQLRKRLDEMLVQEEETGKMEAFHQALLASGLISEIKSPVVDVEAYRRFKPIEVRGKPVSETIIEERR
jgi:hypothetical protein